MERDAARLLAEGWSGVEALLGGAAAVDAAAAEAGAIVRRRQVRDGPQLLRLALRHATAGESLRATAAWGRAALDVALSDVALLGRLRRAEVGDFLEALVGRLLAAGGAPGPGGSWEGPPIRLVDASVFSGPGPGGPQLRLHASYDPAARRFDALELTGVGQGERLGRARLEPGAVAVADRNYARTPQLRDLAARGAFFAVRANLQGVRALDPATGERLTARRVRDALGGAGSAELDALLADAGPARGGPAAEPLRVRLVALRAGDAQAARERRRIARSRSKHGAEPRPETLELAGTVLLATNLDPGDWPPARVAALYRLRWQVELAFKALKSTFAMRRPPARDPQLCRTWLLANLAAALLADRLADALEGALPPSARAAAAAAPPEPGAPAGPLPRAARPVHRRRARRPA